MSTLSSPSMREATSLWDTYAPFLTKPLAATTAAVPVYYGFRVKSALQLEQPFPKMPVCKIVFESLRESPMLGLIVGAQLCAQDFFENNLKRMIEKSNLQNCKPFNNPAKSEQMISFASSVLVGGATAPLLAIFNGRTMGFTILGAVKNLSGKQVGALMVRETAFLASLSISEPINKQVKQEYGASKTVEYAITFFTGLVGALASQPLDTIFTRMQKGLSTTPSQWYNGGLARSFTVAGFAVGYKAAREFLQK